MVKEKTNNHVAVKGSGLGRRGTQGGMRACAADAQRSSMVQGVEQTGTNHQRVYGPTPGPWASEQPQGCYEGQAS